MTSVEEYRELWDLYHPDWINWSVLIRSKGGSVGSGVLVRVGDRHFVATAAHCLEQAPQNVLRRASRILGRSGYSDLLPLRVLDYKLHPSHDNHDGYDVGYIEIADPCCSEILWDQLYTKPIGAEQVHIVGFPSALTTVDDRRKLVAVTPSIVTTELMKATPGSLLFHYPEAGLEYYDGEWTKTPFPETPKGWSGGGCFTVSRSTTAGGIESVAYRLLGIQSAWLRTGRYVRVVPIQHWRDLLMMNKIRP